MNRERITIVQAILLIGILYGCTEGNSTKTDLEPMFLDEIRYDGSPNGGDPSILCNEAEPPYKEDSLKSVSFTQVTTQHANCGLERLLVAKQLNSMIFTDCDFDTLRVVSKWFKRIHFRECKIEALIIQESQMVYEGLYLRRVEGIEKDEFLSNNNQFRFIQLENCPIQELPSWLKYQSNLESLELISDHPIQFPKWLMDLPRLQQITLNGAILDVDSLFQTQ